MQGRLVSVQSEFITIPQDISPPCTSAQCNAYNQNALYTCISAQCVLHQYTALHSEASCSMAICAALHPGQHFSSKDVSTRRNITWCTKYFFCCGYFVHKIFAARSSQSVQRSILCDATQLKANQVQAKLNQI